MNFFKHILSFVWGKHIEQVISPINGELNVYYMFGRYMLYAKSTNYSYGELHKGFQRIFNTIKLKEKKFETVLLLGFGAGSVSSILLEEYKCNCQITAIEKDPVILTLGKKYFNTGRFERLKIQMKDAYDFTLNEPGKYDLIIFDIYINDEIPSQFETETYLNALKQCMNPNGLLVFNKDVNAASMKKGMDRFESIFSKVFHPYQKIHNLKNNFFFIYSHS